MRNYFLYRDLIPLLSESMSVACQNAFAESLAESATNATVAPVASKPLRPFN